MLESIVQNDVLDRKAILDQASDLCAVGADSYRGQPGPQKYLRLVSGVSPWRGSAGGQNQIAAGLPAISACQDSGFGEALGEIERHRRLPGSAHSQVADTDH